MNNNNNNPPAPGPGETACNCWLGTGATFGCSKTRAACPVHGERALPPPPPADDAVRLADDLEKYTTPLMDLADILRLAIAELRRQAARIGELTRELRRLEMEKANLIERNAMLRNRPDLTAEQVAHRLGILAERDAARADVARLTAQLPDGMKTCTILLKECPKGHGWLTATNWIQHGCMKCEQDRLTAEVDIVRAALAERTRLAMLAENERLTAGRVPEDVLKAALGTIEWNERCKDKEAMMPCTAEETRMARYILSLTPTP